MPFLWESLKTYKSIYLNHILHALSNGTKIFEIQPQENGKTQLQNFGKSDFFVFLANNFLLRGLQGSNCPFYCHPQRDAPIYKISCKSEVIKGVKIAKNCFLRPFEFSDFWRYFQKSTSHARICMKFNILIEWKILNWMTLKPFQLEIYFKVKIKVI